MPHIFISHSSKDESFVLELKSRLAEQGHRSVFLDFDPADGIPAGRVWERELYEKIRACQAMVVVCSRSSMASRWCFMELTHARALGKPLIAIRIDDADLDGVLADRQAIDLREGQAVAYERLFRGLAAAGLDPKKTFAWDPSRPPYPGLLAFEETDAAVFFGRSGEIARGLELLNRVQHLGDSNVVMVLGASGSGKSSLVRAGLVSRLRRDVERWLILDPIRPRSNPMRQLAVALGRTCERAGTPRSADEVETILRQSDGADTLVRLLADLRRRTGQTPAQPLLVIDQFEELFANDNAQHGEEFLALLRRVVDHPDRPLFLLATLRSDFLGVLQSSAPLQGLRYELLSVGPMGEKAVQEVIEGPAREAEIEIEPELVRELIEEAGAPNALPLLAFALRELWERCAGDGLLSLDEYRNQLGGIGKVIQQTAEDVLTALGLSDRQLEMLRVAFLAMVRIADGEKHVRRSLRWEQLPPAVHPLLKKFVEARLLVSGTDGQSVEVAHERLFDSWERLQTWIKQSAEALRLRRDVDAAAASWINGAKSPEYHWHGARLKRARELIDAGELLLEEVSRTFIETCEEAERADAAKQERARQRRLVAISAVAIIFAILTVLAVVFAFQAQSNQRKAQQNALLAEERARLAGIASEQALAAQNFAEYQRVLARAQVADATPDQRDALQAIAPKYLDQSRRHAATAAKLQQLLEAWRRQNHLAAKPTSKLFSFEMFRVRGGGSAYMVHYGDRQTPRHLLIDGGMRDTYRDALKPRMAELRGSSASFPLSLVVASQTDAQHIDGLVELLRDQQGADAGHRPYDIGSVWSNAFVPDAAPQPGSHDSTHRKAQLVQYARGMNIPVNAPFSRLITLPEAGAARVRWDDDLSITVLSPPVQWVRVFADFWVRSWMRGSSMGFVVPAPPHEQVPKYDILEKFANPRIELLPSPIEIKNPPSPTGRDRSVPNLASIVLFLEVGGRTMLLPADARADLLLHALAQAGYSDEQGRISVDVLVLPHGGSDNNVSPEFFQRVKARNYFISADGTFAHPRVQTLEMLFAARHGDRTPFAIYLTHRPEEFLQRARYPVDDLCRLLAAERRAGVPFQIVTPKPGQSSVGVDLLAAESFVDKGVTNSICGL